jgi:VWFA-related protein
MRTIPRLESLVVLCSASLITFAQTPTSGPQQPALRVTTTNVLFDVIVRDRSGRPLTGLTLDDFEVEEDGVRQPLVTVHGYGSPGGAVAVPSAPSAPAAPTMATSHPAGVASSAAATVDQTASALLLDQLTPEGRPLAEKVARAMIEAAPAEERLGVFAVGPPFAVLTEFTEDRERARAAIAQGLQRPTASTELAGRSPRGTASGDLRPSVSPTVGAESGGGLPTIHDRKRRLESSDPAERLFAAMEYRMVTSYEELLRQQHGSAAFPALRAVLAGLAPLEGRKALLFFSEGTPTTDQTRPFLETAIALANRVGVAIYAIDVAGLRAHSTIAATAREIDVAGREALGDTQRSQGAWTKDTERRAELVRSGGTGTLALLAQQTGGLLLENSNDANAIAKRIAEDQRHYYMLAFVPAKPELDGSYRKVRVKVKAKGAQVSHRSGYWAIPLQR